MPAIKIIKILIVTVISFCLLFTLSFLAACRETIPAEEALEEEVTEEKVEEILEEEVVEEPEEELVEEEEEEEIIYEIAFYSDHGSPFSVYSCLPDGGDIKKVYDSGSDELYPCWNSGHTKIVFSSTMDGDNDFDLFIYDLINDEISRLTDREGCDLLPIFSPDGKSVVFSGFVGLYEGQPNFEIFTVNSDGSNLKQLTDNPAYDSYPHYSPDGKTIIFTSDRIGSDNLYTMDTEGNNIVQLTDNGGKWWDFDGTFSPDGKKIAFTSDRTAYDDIWVMPVDNLDAAINLTNNSTFDSNPDYSPEGDMITFLSDRDAVMFTYDIFVMDYDGENQTNITPDLTNSSQGEPSW